MDTNILSRVAQLSNADLLAQVTHLAQRERQATVALIAHLAELDARCLYLDEGCSSLFTYCTQVLHLSEHAAYGRIEAARVVRRFPVLLERLAEGAVTLTTVALLAPHLTAENHRDLLDRARHQSKRAVEELVARLSPQPPVPDTIRKLPTRTPVASEPSPALALMQDGTAGGPQPGGDAHDTAVPVPSSAAPAPSSARRAVVTPLAQDRYRVQFTASEALRAKLQQAQALLRHQIPDGNLEQIVDRALTVLLRDLTRQKIAATERPRERQGGVPDPDHGSRHIPAAVKRAVWGRDGGRCAFVAAGGRRCTEEALLEFHHVTPYAAGGAATLENIQLRCRAHNRYEAERGLGRRLPLIVREACAVYGHDPAQSGSTSFVRNIVVNSVRPELIDDAGKEPARPMSPVAHKGLLQFSEGAVTGPWAAIIPRLAADRTGKGSRRGHHPLPPRPPGGNSHDCSTALADRRAILYADG